MTNMGKGHPRKGVVIVKNVLLSICAIGLFSGLFVGPVNADDLTVDIVISPNVINIDSKGVWVTVHAEIPYSVVAGASVKLNGIDVTATFADSRGELVAKFCVDAVKEILEPGTAELTLSGVTKDGISFSGTDTIKVIKVSGGKK